MSETANILREGIPYCLAGIGGAIAISVALSPSMSEAKWAGGFGLAATAIAGAAGIAQPSRQRETASINDPRTGVTAQVQSGDPSDSQRQLPNSPATNPASRSDRSTMPDSNDNFLQIDNPATMPRNDNFEFSISTPVSSTNGQNGQKDQDWISPLQAAES